MGRGKIKNKIKRLSHSTTVWHGSFPIKISLQKYLMKRKKQ